MGKKMRFWGTGGVVAVIVLAIALAVFARTPPSPPIAKATLVMTHMPMPLATNNEEGAALCVGIDPSLGTLLASATADQGPGMTVLSLGYTRLAKKGTLVTISTDAAGNKTCAFGQPEILSGDTLGRAKRGVWAGVFDSSTSKADIATVLELYPSPSDAADTLSFFVTEHVPEEAYQAQMPGQNAA